MPTNITDEEQMSGLTDGVMRSFGRTSELCATPMSTDELLRFLGER